MKKKLILTLLSIVLLLTMGVMSTLAFLTDRDKVVNVFTVGDVQITLDEAKVTPDGKPVDPAERVQENEYHLLPGLSYTKDPTLTVKANSELSYIRILVTIEQMDKVLFIEDGRLAAFGKHDDLYETCPSYRKMVDLQKLEEEGGAHNA